MQNQPRSIPSPLDSPIWRPSKVTTFEFYQDFRHTRTTESKCCSATLCDPANSVEHRLVTDGQTDRESQNTVNIAEMQEIREFVFIT